jgi:hypothetical protein
MTAEFSPPEMKLFRNVSLFDADYSEKKKFLHVTPEKSFDYSKFLNWQTVSPVK